LNEDRPKFLPKSRGGRKQSVVAGLHYEKCLADYLADRFGEENVKHGQWFEYCDEQGKGWAQTDVLVFTGPYVLIVEAKLTYTKRAAKSKLLGIYKPLVEKVWPDKKVRMVQVCKNLTWRARGQVLLSDLEDITTSMVRYKFATWNWRPQ
jgi:hypothetical protein